MWEIVQSFLIISCIKFGPWHYFFLSILSDASLFYSVWSCFVDSLGLCPCRVFFLLELLPTLPFCSSSHNDRDMPVRYQTCWDKLQNKTNKKREKWLYFGQQLSTPPLPPPFRHLTPTYDTQTQSSIVKPRVMCYSQPCLVLLWEESVPLSRPFKWWPAWTVSHESSVQCVCGRPWFWIAGVVGWHFACFVLTHFQILDLVCTHYCPLSFCLKFCLFFLSFFLPLLVITHIDSFLDVSCLIATSTWCYCFVSTSVNFWIFVFLAAPLLF